MHVSCCWEAFLFAYSVGQQIINDVVLVGRMPAPCWLKVNLFCGAAGGGMQECAGRGAPTAAHPGGMPCGVPGELTGALWCQEAQQGGG
jgi:hypothetical protein